MVLRVLTFAVARISCNSLQAPAPRRPAPARRSSPRRPPSDTTRSQVCVRAEQAHHPVERGREGYRHECRQHVAERLGVDLARYPGITPRAPACAPATARRTPIGPRPRRDAPTSPAHRRPSSRASNRDRCRRDVRPPRPLPETIAAAPGDSPSNSTGAPRKRVSMARITTVHPARRHRRRSTVRRRSRSPPGSPGPPPRRPDPRGPGCTTRPHRPPAARSGRRSGGSAG